MEENLIIELTDQCRICMETTEELFDMFGMVLGFIEQESKSIYEIFGKCTGLLVTENDGLTRSLCKVCFERLKGCMLLRRQANTSNSELKGKSQDQIILSTYSLVGPDIQDENNKITIVADKCRICMKTAEVMFEMFSATLEIKQGHTRALNDVFEGITGVTPSKIDDLPASLCTECVSRLKCCALLHIKADETYKELRELQARGIGSNTEGRTNPSSKETETTYDQEQLQFDSKKKFECKVCHKRFQWRSEMNAHLRSQHSDYKPISCDFCERTFVSTDDCETHTMIHTKSPCYPCSSCQRKFYTAACCKEHEENHKKQKYDCTICGKFYNTVSYLKRHMRIHPNTEVFVCPVCKKAFSTSESCVEHTQKHKGKTFTCHVCSKEFFRSYHLQRHLRIHTEDRPFFCNICSKTFKDAERLEAHMCIHYDSKQIYSCVICTKGFHEIGGLEQHMEIHTNQRSDKKDGTEELS